MFELESPEVFDGTVEIKGVAREAGSRTKMAVVSHNDNVDAVGACVGTNGARVDIVVDELGGEKIDIIPWSDNPAEYIAAALRPSDVVAVQLADDENERSAKVVVPDTQLSLAIGKEGQNVRLAAKLTGWKIDIKSETQARATDFIDFDAFDHYDEYVEEVTNEAENEDIEE
jgi:N utilization substance protein A